MSALDTERVILDDLEHDIPCGASMHEKVGDGEAVFIVWQNVPCCDKRPSFGFSCEPCLDYALTYPGPLFCPDCGWRTKDYPSCIVRVERIKP